jgi:adenylosuccinate lyase
VVSLSPLSAVTSLDGRYHTATTVLQPYLSEQALFLYRIKTELAYLKHLSRLKVIRPLSIKEISILDDLPKGFNEKEAKKIKKLEEETHHDMKALEYYLAAYLHKTTLRDICHMIHFGLTSDDTNNIAQSLMLKDLNQSIILPACERLISLLNESVTKYQKTPFVARTHGQPAVPTTYGKEISVYVQRIKKIEKKLKAFVFEAKLTGAVGNYNGMAFLYPHIDWINENSYFIKKMGLSSNTTTTQILPYDNLIEYFSHIQLLNSVLIGLCQDIWLYASYGLISLRSERKQVGSSTMPQKINPWRFESAEGNLYIANSLFTLYCQKLPISRMQRDLTDSTIKRSFGEAFGHTFVAYNLLCQELPKTTFNKDVALQELNNHYEVLMEAVQLYLKKIGRTDGYERIKDISKGNSFTKQSYIACINALKLQPKDEEVIINLLPQDYVGLVEDIIKHV